MINYYKKQNEPPHDKTNKMACAPSEDSDQPGHPPSLIRVFAVRMKKSWVLSYPLSAQRRLIRLGRCPGWSEISLDRMPFCWFCHEVAQMNMYGKIPLEAVWSGTSFIIDSTVNFLNIQTPQKELLCLRRKFSLNNPWAEVECSNDAEDFVISIYW